MAKSELDDIKKYVIGVFYLPQVGQFELVIRENDTTLDTIAITSFGVINESFSVPKHFGDYHKFPENKYMRQMLKDPQDWADFIKKFTR